MLKTLKDIDVTDKRILLRVDFNVPFDETGRIKDDKRIKSAIPTIEYLLDHNAKQILILTHIGRPKGDIVDELKTDKVAAKLNELLKKDVVKVDDCVNISIPEDEKIIMLENVRFHKAEKENNEHFAEGLARQADIYVNDAFGTCHRKHASVHAITKVLPSYAGLLLEKEVTILNNTLSNPQRPFIAIIGGVKLETKIPVIENLLNKVDKILVGGAMIFTFFKAKGFEVGKNIVDELELETTKRILEKAGEKIILPVDILVVEAAEAGSPSKTVGITEIPNEMLGVDIGQETIAYFVEEIKKAKTVLWNGTLGLNEIEEFAQGSKRIAQEMAASPGQTIIGGGDTVGFIRGLGLGAKMNHVSTGGGATLTFLQGQELPALKVLEQS